MRRITTAREQYDMLVPWLLTAAPKMIDAPEFAGVPGMAGEIPDPGKALIDSGRPGEPMRMPKYTPSAPDAKRQKVIPEVPDPVSDPNYRLEKAGHGFEDMVGNLESHYHGATNQQKKDGRLWYRSAHDFFKKLALDHGISHERAVAIGSALSPNTDWDVNMKLAGQFLKKYRPHDNPDHNEQDWRMAHIHPDVLKQFKAENGDRDPGTDPDDPTGAADIDRLGDMHVAAGSFGGALSDPEAMADWKGLAAHHGLEKVVADHASQAFANRNKAPTKANPKGGYNPKVPIRDAGIPTLGSNIKKAKMIRRSREALDFFHNVLGGPKTRNFSSNILDPTRISKDGYYRHPGGDWTKHEDLGGTIDAHHIRASSMAHGAWEAKEYRDDKAASPSDPYVYDTYNRGLFEATKRINGTIADPRKHLTPKQVQAIVWIKHKNDNERFKAMGVTHESQVTPRMHRDYNRMMRQKKLEQQQAAQQVVAALEPEDFAEMPPLWRKMFHTRETPEWMDLLRAWVDHHSPEPAEDDGSDHQRPGPGEDHLGSRDRDVDDWLTWS